MSDIHNREWPMLLNESMAQANVRHVTLANETFRQFLMRWQRSREIPLWLLLSTLSLPASILVALLCHLSGLLFVVVATTSPFVVSGIASMVRARWLYVRQKRLADLPGVRAIARAFETRPEIFEEAPVLGARKQAVVEALDALLTVFVREFDTQEQFDSPNAKLIDECIKALSIRLDAIYAQCDVLAAEQQTLIKAYSSPPADSAPSLPSPHAPTADRA